VASVQELARQHTPEAIAALVAALNSPRERVAAASVLLDRGWGRPLQAIAGDREAPPIAIHFTWADAATEPTSISHADALTIGTGSADEDDASTEIRVVWPSC
jgi:hypothetical protein